MYIENKFEWVCSCEQVIRESLRFLMRSRLDKSIYILIKKSLQAGTILCQVIKSRPLDQYSEWINIDPGHIVHVRIAQGWYQLENYAIGKINYIKDYQDTWHPQETDYYIFVN
jgi:hypothetical protein